MTKRRDGPRRASKRLANHTPSASASTSTLDHPRRSKGRARTRASGVKIIDDPMEDEKRLKDQLTRMGFYAVNTLGDGNCLFRALSDQLYGTPNRHLEIRQQVCGYLAQHEARYKAFVDMDEEESWESHLKLMAKQGTYGGHLELSAFANFHRRPIKIIQPGMVYVISYGDESPATCSGKAKGKQLKGKGKRSEESVPLVSPSDTPVYLVYHQWEHYSSVRNLDGPHSGIPCIRERDLESSASIDQSGQGGTEGGGGGGGKGRKLSMMSYRECSSSPVSAGSSSTTTTTTTTTGSSSSGSGAPSGEDPTEKIEADDRPGSSLADRPRRTKKASKRPPLHSPITRPPPPPPATTNKLVVPDRHQTKPLSKRALRLARRNNQLPSNNSSSAPLAPPIDSVGLLRELKV
ncbi:hypothetical protein PGT21_050354 [Puccinia graminis f. sp. tritici]|uniref:OTU domain-containing protein n=1 Tax=Puccinia graminis f. sp. tritici TaxID=56615 RepID=A0A5B0PU08_PUCGR|nr:hypothetical protein PGT21_050354 [Puccinia graminis f. sp. tritici]KAA1128220.1 hypothetical protein PGTUg99_050083 [Puccinia graminis f. sp. tritici]